MDGQRLHSKFASDALLTRCGKSQKSPILLIWRLCHDPMGLRLLAWTFAAFSSDSVTQWVQNRCAKACHAEPLNRCCFWVAGI
jgi:hypothetical protein